MPCEQYPHIFTDNRIPRSSWSPVGKNSTDSPHYLIHAYLPHFLSPYFKFTVNRQFLNQRPNRLYLGLLGQKQGINSVQQVQLFYLFVRTLGLIFYQSVFIKKSIMNQKFTYDQYQICTSFKSNNVMTISAEFVPTAEHFLSGTVQLMRIQKDTVIAALQRKSEKNLRCQFEQVVDKENKFLVIKFVVNFDFLPEFSEEVKLEYVEKKESIKNMQVNNFKADVEMMEEMISAYEKNGVWVHSQASASYTSNQPQTLKEFQVTQGRYLLKITGVYTTSLGQMGVCDKVTFYFVAPGKAEKKKIDYFMHSCTGYSYPFSFEEVVECCQGSLKIEVQASLSQWSISGTHILFYPIPDFR